MEDNTKKRVVPVYLIVGIVLLISGFLIAMISTAKDRAVSDGSGDNGVVINEKKILNELEIAVDATVPEKYKQSKYDLLISDYNHNSKYTVQMDFSDNDKTLYEPEFCGSAATEFLTTFKREHAELDGYVETYFFWFYSQGKIIYTAEYDNTEAAGSIALTLKKDDQPLQTKSYDEYAADAAALRKLLDENPNTYMLKELEDGATDILPRCEADKIINPDSSLMQYEHDYCADKFLLSKVKMEADNDETTVSLIFTDSSETDYESVYVYCDLIDSEGIVIYQIMDSAYDVKAGQSYKMELWKYYGSDDIKPAEFRLTSVVMYKGNNKGTKILFD